MGWRRRGIEPTPLKAKVEPDMSRFAKKGTTRAPLDIYTAVSGIALLVMILGCLYLVLHNMENGSAQDGRQAGSPFEILQ